MHNSQVQMNDEIDIKEVLLSIWAYKYFLIIISVISMVIAGFYAANVEKVYRATTTFKLASLETNKSMRLNEGLSSLIGLGDDDNDLLDLQERISGRAFIELLDEKLELRSDPYFNYFNANAVVPVWKSVIKQFLGISNDTQDINEIIWSSVITSFRTNVLIEITDGANIRIKVKHTDPERAAEIANTLTDTIIGNQTEKQKNNQKKLADYFSVLLADALYDVEVSENKLKDFAVENSSTPTEMFAFASRNLKLKKEQFEQTEELYFAVKALFDLYVGDKIDQEGYTFLKKSHPIVDQGVFRRIFGQNEFNSKWQWPDEKSVSNVFQTLNERKNSLERALIDAKLRVEELSDKMNEFAMLNRKTKLSEATYKVMYEQVKSSALVTGFNGVESEVYEYAVTPVSPYFPKTKLVIILGGGFGLILGLFISLILSKARGVYFSTTTLLSENNAEYQNSLKSLLKFQKRSNSYLDDTFKRNPSIIIHDLNSLIIKEKKQYIMISGIGSKIKVRDFSRIFSVNMQNSKNSLVCIDFTKVVKEKLSENGKEVIPSLQMVDEYKNLKFMCPAEPLRAINFITRYGSKKLIDDLKAQVDQVVFSVEGKDAINLARYLGPENIYHIALTRKKKTKRKLLEEICSIIPLGAQFYD